MPNSREKSLAWYLVGFAFLSKISFGFTGVVPQSLGFLIFQAGIHPYLNVLGNFIFAGIFIYYLTKTNKLSTFLKGFHPLYKVFAIGTIAILWLQHIFQYLSNPEVNPLLLFFTICSSTLLILVFGFFIPKVIPFSEYAFGVMRICLILCGISILLFLLGAPSIYKGGRFIGIFKHIPYMVTAATVGFIFHLPEWFKADSLTKKLRFAGLQFLFFLCLLLTGTRSAFLAVIGALCLYFLLTPSPTRGFQTARYLGIWISLLAVLLFGTMAYDYAHDVATGKIGFAQREAQDGVHDRLEEISRGIEMVEKSPHFGLGLLSKFSSAEGEEVVENYNSFQDPHNLFISSAVVAGWPFGLWVFWGYLAFVLGLLKILWSRNSTYLILGVFLLTHAPILMIYHMHLSLGGLADRLYWLVFGYLGLYHGVRRVSLAAVEQSEKML